MKSSNLYPLKIKAEAMEQLLSGKSVKEVAKEIGCSIQTVSQWFMYYLGYRGKEGITEVKQSIINNSDKGNY